MEKDIKIIKLTNLLNDISWTISNAEETLGDLEMRKSNKGYRQSKKRTKTRRIIFRKTRRLFRKLYEVL